MTNLKVALFIALLSVIQVVAQEMYTQNSVCRTNFCINPIFPGLNDLARLELLTWQCPPSGDSSAYKSSMNFCGNAILYPPAVPSPNTSATSLQALVQAQDNAAATMFFYHMNGLGYEAWENSEPWNSPDSCVVATWRMTCLTYFPKAQAGCQQGQPTKYLRPCKDCCQNYLQACRVECCDESAACVFTHTLDVGDGQALVQTGYVDAVAPSALCTGIGGSNRVSAPMALILGLFFGVQWMLTDVEGGTSPSRLTTIPDKGPSTTSVFLKPVVMALVIFTIFTSLVGCDMTIPSHSLGNWRQQEDYLVKYEFVPPGATPLDATLNSCGSANVAANYGTAVQCSGRGFCKAWNPQAANSLAFCYCDRDYADPECRTKRKSQKVAFFLSLFLGVFGADYFYLGLPLWGSAKLCTFGGLGFWWLVDIIRTGAGPVYAHDFRVAADLPHWFFVMLTVFIFLILGFVGAMMGYFRFRSKKRRDVMMLQEAEESRSIRSAEEISKLGPQYYPMGGMANFANPRGFSGYGATLPVSMPNADAPFAQPLGPDYGQPGPFSGPYQYDPATGHS